MLAAGIAPAMAESKGLIGISMPTKSSTRWISDGESMVKEFTALGYETDLQYAEDDIPNQLAQIENMVTKGAKVLDHRRDRRHHAVGHPARRPMTAASRSSPMTA